MLKGDTVIDFTTMRDMPVSEVQDALIEWGEVIEFFQAVDTGLITLSYSEMKTLPGYIRPLWKVFKNTKFEVFNPKK